jgi:uncharacterized protein (TIRG00374 family)
MSDTDTDTDTDTREPDEQTAASDAHRLRRGLISTVVVAALLLAIAFAVPGLKSVLDEIGNASPGWLVIGVGFELLSCVGYVMVVRLILPHGPPRGVRMLAWAEMAFGAVVPAGGAGSLAVGAWAMRAWHVDTHRIAERSAVLFMLTSAINVIVLLPCGLLFAAGVNRGDLSIWYGLVPAAVAAGCLAFFVWLPTQTKHGASSKHRFARWMAETGDWVTATEKALFTRNWRVLGAFAYLLCDMAVLVVCLHALGLRAPIISVLLGYQIGLLANIIPIPGGIGVVEGGVTGALVLYGLPATKTAAAVVIYHAISLWIPTIGGTIAFLRMRRAVAAGPPPGFEISPAS